MSYGYYHDSIVLVKQFVCGTCITVKRDLVFGGLVLSLSLKLVRNGMLVYNALGGLNVGM